MKRWKVGEITIYFLTVPRRYWRYAERVMHQSGGRNQCVTFRPWIFIADVCKG